MDFSSHNPTTSNSLNLAARNNDVSNVRRLLKKINPNCVDNRGWTCLHEAANSDSYECLALILEHPDCRPLSKTHEGHTALYLACRNRCSLKTITVILETVGGIANCSSTEGVTPLHVVSKQGRVELIKLLLKYGAIIDVKDFDGDTPLHEACLAQQPEAVKVLLCAGANPRIQNDQLFTPFHIACAGTSLDSAANLIHYSVDVNQRTVTGETPLMISLRSNNEYMIYLLLENGADPNLKNIDDKLALDIAIDIGFSSVFRKLLSVTNNNVINANIVCRACKPHYFAFDILKALLTSDIGPKFFMFTEPCPESLAETIDDLKPLYLTHAPLNAYLNICEYIYKISQEIFKEYFNLFLMRGVQNQLLHKIDSNCEITVAEYRACFVPPLKHLSRLKVRDIIKTKDGVVKTTQQFLEILNNLPVPQIIKEYLRFL
ncbi:Ankyrin repeat and SOCS box protein 3 [Operophtera brumata]|uniref:Ankyrin repeat and SOCS box protein 3 n=1 Tax=Operophtera brumata TaxID=104452 RepID=A0A0L7LBM1_OPEBR|nr:Ankyrin repeat and SOCS box protein 3 [Operophtera brumata]